MSSASSVECGPYLLGEKLGEGLQGVVYSAVLKSSGESVALKCFFADKLSARAQENLEKEIKAMQALSACDHVVRLRRVVKGLRIDGKDVSFCLELELCNGRELFHYLMYTGFFDEKLARTYFRQLVEAVKAMHDAGYVHRDIKAENVLLHTGLLKLADFGFAKENRTDAATHLTQCGTPGYMAPELWKDEAYAGKPADIWSTGCVLFIMLFGAPPMAEARGDDWWYNRLLEGRHRLFWRAHEQGGRVISDDAKDLLIRMLRVDPAHRITIADVYKHPWFVSDDVHTNAAAMGILQERKRTIDAMVGTSTGEAVSKMDEDEDDTFDPFDDAAPVYRGLKDARETRYVVRVKCTWNEVESAVRSAAKIVGSDVDVVQQQSRVFTARLRTPTSFAVQHSANSVKMTRLSGDILAFNRMFVAIESALLDSKSLASLFKKQLAFGALLPPSPSLVLEAKKKTATTTTASKEEGA